MKKKKENTIPVLLQKITSPEKIIKVFPTGTEIKLIAKADNPKLKKDLLGTVVRVTPEGLIEIIWETGEFDTLNICEDAFDKIYPISAIYVEKGKPAQTIKVGNDYLTIRKILNCDNICSSYIFQDPVILLKDDDADYKGLPVNRTIYKENTLIDMVSGPFLLVRISANADFISIPATLEAKYRNLFSKIDKIVIE